MVVDHSPAPGGAWQFRWPSLTYGKVHGVHSLPGMELTGADPARPSAEVVGEYFAAYERAFDLRVRRPVDVRAVREGTGGRLLVEDVGGNRSTRALINATGTWDPPSLAPLSGPGDSSGGGNCTRRGTPVPRSSPGSAWSWWAGAPRGRSTCWISPARRGHHVGDQAAPVFREGPFDEEGPKARVALVEERGAAGAAAEERGVGDRFAAERRDPGGAGGRGAGPAANMFDRITPEGVEWGDGRRVAADVILWATGFRPAIEHLSAAAAGGRRRDPRRGGRARSRTRGSILVGYGPRPAPSAPTGPTRSRTGHQAAAGLSGAVAA